MQLVVYYGFVLGVVNGTHTKLHGISIKSGVGIAKVMLK